MTNSMRKQIFKDEMTKKGKQVVFTIEELPKIRMNGKYVYFFKIILAHFWHIYMCQNGIN